VAQPIAFEPGKLKRLGYGDAEPGLSPTLRADAGDNQLAVAQPIGFTRCDHGGDAVIDGTPTMRCGSNYSAHLAAVIPNMAVRRLTPVECERLQGFPDNYTNIPWRKQPESPDGPRYKALGNSWAVPVVKWIGERIERSLA
jgi:DNA (cytosine-5)-methyltransferase 1